MSQKPEAKGRRQEAESGKRKAESGRRAFSFRLLASRFWLLAASCWLLVACDSRDPHYANTKPGLVYRRNDVAFTPQVDHPSEESLAGARRIDEIEQLVNDGMNGQAQVALTKYFDDGGEHPRAFLLQGRLHYVKGELDQAIPWFEKSVEKSPRWIDPRLMLAQCFYRTNRLAAAEGVFDEIDRLAAKSPWGPYGKGLVAHARGDTERATQLIDEALTRDARHVPSLRVRAELAHNANDVVLEEQLLRRWLKEDTQAAAAHERLGDLAMGAGRTLEAQRYFQTSYDLEPKASVARRLAEIATMRGDEQEARVWQKRAGIATNDAKPAAPVP